MDNTAYDFTADDLVFLTTADVQEKLGMSKPTLYRRRRDDPSFPKAIVISGSVDAPKAIRFAKHEIEAWMQQQLASREA